MATCIQVLRLIDKHDHENINGKSFIKDIIKMFDRPDGVIIQALCRLRPHLIIPWSFKQEGVL